MSKSFLLTFVSIGAEKVFKKKLKTATVTYLCPDDPPLVKELHHPYVEVPSVCVCVCVCVSACVVTTQLTLKLCAQKTDSVPI